MRAAMRPRGGNRSGEMGVTWLVESIAAPHRRGGKANAKWFVATHGPGRNVGYTFG